MFKRKVQIDDSTYYGIVFFHLQNGRKKALCEAKQQSCQKRLRTQSDDFVNIGHSYLYQVFFKPHKAALRFSSSQNSEAILNDFE